jgi:hypothetical protein
MTNSSLKPDTAMTRFVRSPWLVAVILALALIARLYEIGSISNDFHAVRQYSTALQVRPDYLATLPDTPAWRLENARLNQLPLLEPPYIQQAALLTYRLAGGENLALPRAISAIFWVIGGYFLYLLGKKLFTPEAALLAMVFFLFAPFGLLASRSFQSNPTMLALIIISIYAMIGYFENPTSRRLLWVILPAAAAMLVMIYAVFILLPAYYALAIQAKGWRRATFSRDTILFGFFSLLPSGLYYLNGFIGAGFLRGQTGSLMMPSLWTTPAYWINWANFVVTVIGLVPLILSINVLVTARRSPTAALMRGLWGGYIIFGLLINYPIMSHSYYSLPLLLNAALSIGCIAHQFFTRLPADRRPMLTASAATAISALIVVFGLVQYLPTTVTTEEQRRSVQAAQEIGERLDHTSHMIYLTSDYGMNLQYYGELAGSAWPNIATLSLYNIAGRPQLTVEERLQQLMAQRDYRYFVVTSMREFALHADLVQYLDYRYPVLAQTDDYIIYSLEAEPGAVSEGAKRAYSP